MRKRVLEQEYDWVCYVCRTGFDEYDVFVEHFNATHW